MSERECGCLDRPTGRAGRICPKCGTRIRLAVFEREYEEERDTPSISHRPPRPFRSFLKLDPSREI